MTHSISKALRFSGQAQLPADKSIAHRAALFASIANGVSTLENFPQSQDPQSTLSCLKQLGVPIREFSNHTIIVEGGGRKAFRKPDAPLNCGNSGTTMRLLSGMLVGQPFESELIGDASLSARPMGRIVEPLQAMGANLTLTDGHAPIRIQPSNQIHGIDYSLPVASAQVKSCVLLAGLWADGETVVRESVPSRDHTERMLHLPVSESNQQTLISSDASLPIPHGTVVLPGDFSAAAFILVAASILGTAPVHLPKIGLNPTRTGLLDVLQHMGANIKIHNVSSSEIEPFGDLTVERATLRGISIGGDQIPNIIDEIPIIAVAGAFSKGVTIVRDAKELRYKECDRIHVMVKNLRRLGAEIEEYEDGFAITGRVPLKGNTVTSDHDHRIAMAMAIAGLASDGTTTIQNADATSVSFPEFWECIARLQK